MQFEVRLVHAEAGRRVVEARALEQGVLLGSALGEDATAEAAEDRALERLCRRLGRALPAQPGPSSSEASPPGKVAPPSACTDRRSETRQPQAMIRRDAQTVRGTAEQTAAEPPDRKASEEAAALPIAAAALDPEDTTALPADVSPPSPSPTDAPRPNRGPASAPSLPPLAPVQAQAPEPEEVPPSDPEDWSAELTRLDLALRRIGWGREQEGEYLNRAFGHPSRSRLTRYADLLAYLRRLESLESGADPLLAPVPLRRRDLLEQGDQLLSQLGWDGERARAFSEAQLGVRSRRQLSDEQLLQFNMLMESELLERTRPPQPAGEAGSGPALEQSPAA